MRLSRTRRRAARPATHRRGAAGSGGRLWFLVSLRSNRGVGDTAGRVAGASVFDRQPFFDAVQPTSAIGKWLVDVSFFSGERRERLSKRQYMMLDLGKF